MEESTEDSAPKSSSRELNRRGRNRVMPAPESNEVDERATAGTLVPFSTKEWLTIDELFVKKTKLPCPEVLMDHLKRRGILHESAAMRIIDEVTKVLREEPNVITVAAPVSICGDVHGQIYNLPKIFEKGGNPSDKNYLFLGNYVNRGNFGIEVLLYLWSLKLNHPETFFMLRGNHECRRLAECFTFKKECWLKYSVEVYEACIKAFQCLPLAAIVNRQFFCVHGGLSPEISTIEDISEIDRFGEPSSDDRLFDLLWSDPTRDYEDERKKDQHFFPNEMRGCSYYYGYDAVSEFLNKNRLISIVRSHEVQVDGFKEYRPVDDFPSLITVFSTPDYLEYHTNKGCVLSFVQNDFDTNQFDRVSDPYAPTTQSPVTSIPDHINNLTDAQLDLMNFALKEHHNNSTFDNSGFFLLLCCSYSREYRDRLLAVEKSMETIRITLNATWIKFLAIREQMKSSLREHYLNHSVARAISENATAANAMQSYQPYFEMAKGMNAEDERKRLRGEESSEVPSPAEKRLTMEELYNTQTKLPRHEVLKDHLKRRGLLEESAALRIIREVTDVLRGEPNVVDVAEPVAICGDVHGQFYNLLEILDLGAQIKDPERRKPKEANFLLLGNYVNRGNFGIEVLLYLWSLKLKHPKKFFMLRGNHECHDLAKCFTFQEECRLKYSDEVYGACMKAFDCLPLAAIVDEQLFCVHGGLSPKISTLKDIKKINRFGGPSSDDRLFDLLWSDPTRDYEDERKKDQHFFPNEMRGCSYYYGYDAVRKFLTDNDLISIVRAHEVQEKGHKEYRPVDDFPSLFTVFSTPDYLDYHTNKGCVSVYYRNKIDHRPFDRVSDPYVPTTQSPVTSIPDHINKVTDAQLDLMNFALNEYNNSTLGDEKSKVTIRRTLIATWMNFLSIWEEMKSALKVHYEKRYIIDEALEQYRPTFEQAKDLNAEDERKRLRGGKPNEKEKINAQNAEMEAMESGTVSPSSREN